MDDPRPKPERLAKITSGTVNIINIIIGFMPLMAI